MKKILLCTLLIFSISTVAFCQASTGELLANKIATKMEDSLLLTSQQRDQIFNVNLNLFTQKQALRSIYSGDNLRLHVQSVENQRDSLYQAILSAQEYAAYKQKKRNLINNN